MAAAQATPMALPHAHGGQRPASLKKRKAADSVAAAALAASALSAAAAAAAPMAGGAGAEPGTGDAAAAAAAGEGTLCEGGHLELLFGLLQRPEFMRSSTHLEQTLQLLEHVTLPLVCVRDGGLAPSAAPESPPSETAGTSAAAASTVDGGARSAAAAMVSASRAADTPRGEAMVEDQAADEAAVQRAAAPVDAVEAVEAVEAMEAVEAESGATPAAAARAEAALPGVGPLGPEPPLVRLEVDLHPRSWNFAPQTTAFPSSF
jgi:hypothetical protein